MKEWMFGNIFFIEDVSFFENEGLTLLNENFHIYIYIQWKHHIDYWLNDQVKNVISVD